MRLLIAESDRLSGESIAGELRDRGYVTDLVRDGETALSYVRCREYTAAVIGWHLPGLPVVRRIRMRNTRLPVLLTGPTAAADRVAGLDAGADDFQAAPFDPAELAARLRALHRRARDATGPAVTVAGITLDPAARQASDAFGALPLTVTELGILEVLIRRHPAAVTRPVIAAAVWRDDAKSLGSNTISVHMSRIRAKLPRGARIETVHGIGYRLRAVALAVA